MNDPKASENGCGLLLAQSDGCTVRQFRNEAGDGTMTTYDIFPGVALSFNDFHMEYIDSTYIPDRRLLAIDHCREGSMEHVAEDGLVGYTTAGDMKLDLRRRHTGRFTFPTCHYHGLTVAVDLDIIERSLTEEVRDFPAVPETVVTRFSLGDCPRVLHGTDEAEHIFGELYRVPEKIRIPYFKIKILELFLYLDAMTVICRVPSDRWRDARLLAEFCKSLFHFLPDLPRRGRCGDQFLAHISHILLQGDCRP